MTHRHPVAGPCGACLRRDVRRGRTTSCRNVRAIRPACCERSRCRRRECDCSSRTGRWSARGTRAPGRGALPDTVRSTRAAWRALRPRSYAATHHLTERASGPRGGWRPWPRFYCAARAWRQCQSGGDGGHRTNGAVALRRQRFLGARMRPRNPPVRKVGCARRPAVRVGIHAVSTRVTGTIVGCSTVQPGWQWMFQEFF